MTNEIFNNMPQVSIQNSTTANVKPQQPAQTAAPTASVPVKDSIPAAQVNNGPQTDVAELSTADKPKKGPIKKFKGFIAGIKKFFASAGEYIKGSVKGLISGAVAGSIVYSAGSLFNGARAKSAAKVGEEAVKSLKKFPAKTVALIAGGLAVAVNLFNASLNVTEKKSNIEHRWVGHYNK